MASTANGADALTREMSAALNAEKDTAGPEDDAMTPEQVMRSISKRAEQSQKSRTTRTSYELVDQASPIRRSQTHGNLGRRPRTSPSTGGSHKGVSRSQSHAGMRRPKSQKSMRRGQSFGFAGYQSPGGEANAEAMSKAQNIMRDKPALKKFLARTESREACAAMGIPEKDLLPKPKSAFRREEHRAEVLPKAKQEKRFSHFENRRMWKLAVVITAAEKIEQEANQEQRKHGSSNEDNLATVFRAAVGAEHNRTKKIAVAREKVVNVLTRENSLLKDRRQEFKQRSQIFHARNKRLEEQREQLRQDLKRRAQERQEGIERVQQLRELKEKARIAESVNQFNERNERIQEFLDRRNMGNLARKSEKNEMSEKRQRVREEAKKRDRAKRELLRHKLDEKAHQADHVYMERVRSLEEKSEEKKLLQKTRIENAARVRRMAANEKTKAAKKMQAAYERMRHMDEVRTAIEVERRAAKKQEIIAKDKWKLATTLERNITPGPGEYHVPSSMAAGRGGTWGKHKPKSDVEWQIYRAAQIPGPGAYQLPSSVLVPGGTWGKHKPKSDVEWMMYRAAQIPGPGAYQPRALKSGVAVKFGNHNPPSDLDIAIRAARDLPGPGEYSPMVTPPPRKSLKDLEKIVKRTESKRDIVQKN